MSVVGDWDVTIKTLIGSLAVVYAFTTDGDDIAGSATGQGETVPLRMPSPMNLADNGLPGVRR